MSSNQNNENINVIPTVQGSKKREWDKTWSTKRTREK